MLPNLFFNKRLFYSLLLSSSFFSFIFLKEIKAEDYGVYGNTFEIEEQDLLENINEKLKTIDIDKWQNDFIEQSKKSINRPKYVILPEAKKEKIYYFDPSIILKKDYYDNKGTIFAKKGTKINPLDKVSLSRQLIFIDGEKEKQLNYAVDFYNKNDKKVKIILVNGAIIDLMKKYNIQLYFDQNSSLIKKFHIENLPAIVSQEGNLLKIKEVVCE